MSHYVKKQYSDVYCHKYKHWIYDLHFPGDLPLDKRLNMHDVVIFIKPVFNTIYNDHYYQMFKKMFK